MKLTSSLSLLLFLQVTASAPIPHHRDHHQTFQTPLTSHLSLTSKPATPPTTFSSNPHFPPHQLDDHSQPLTPFDNAPKTPSSNVSPSAALSANTPLTSAYLLSLYHPTPSSLDSPPSPTEDEEALPSKPTSALPYLRQLDSIRYWASLRTDPSPNPQTHPKNAPILDLDLAIAEREVGGFFVDLEVVESNGPVSPITRCSEYLRAIGAGSSAYMSIGLARDYSDFLVVGIVVLFLALVVVVELVLYLRQRVFGHTSRRGAIYLDDECEWENKRPFSLQPAPMGKYRVIDAKKEYKDFDSDAETVVEEWRYYDDAVKKV